MKKNLLEIQTQNLLKNKTPWNQITKSKEKQNSLKMQTKNLWDFFYNTWLILVNFTCDHWSLARKSRKVLHLTKSGNAKNYNLEPKLVLTLSKAAAIDLAFKSFPPCLWAPAAPYAARESWDFLKSFPELNAKCCSIATATPFGRFLKHFIRASSWLNPKPGNSFLKVFSKLLSNSNISSLLAFILSMIVLPSIKSCSAIFFNSSFSTMTLLKMCERYF